MHLKPIRTPADHAAALEEVARLMALDPAEGSPEGDALDILATLVERYEAERMPVALPDPVAAIATRMADKQLSPADLDALLGRPGRTADLLSRRRPLTLPAVRTLAQALDLPAEVLLQPYRRATAAA